MVLGTMRGSTSISRILVAGGAGFIGSHLVDHFLKQENTKRVIVVDNFISGTKENLKPFMGDDRLDVLEMDITDRTVVGSAGRDFDLVLHLAAVANPLDYERKPLETLKTNSDGSQNLIEIASQSSAKYVFFSSSEIYGNHNSMPKTALSESTQSRIILNQKRSPYVVGKCFGEEMTINLCGKMGVDHLIVRPFNIYGPNMDLMTDYGRVIPNFCIWGLRGEPLRIHGDGTQVRTFCYIDDLVEALFMLLTNGVKRRSINIGHPYPISILDLARLISRILEIEERFDFVERYMFEPYVRIPDIKLIKDLTDWKPHVDLRIGLMRTIEWFASMGLSKYGRNSSQ